MISLGPGTNGRRGKGKAVPGIAFRLRPLQGFGCRGRRPHVSGGPRHLRDSRDRGLGPPGGTSRLRVDPAGREYPRRRPLSGSDHPIWRPHRPRVLRLWRDDQPVPVPGREYPADGGRPPAVLPVSVTASSQRIPGTGDRARKSWRIANSRGPHPGHRRTVVWPYCSIA
jgi:hypothetical protein